MWHWVQISVKFNCNSYIFLQENAIENIVCEMATILSRGEMRTSSSWNIFRVTGHLCGKFTDRRWISPHKGQWRGSLMFSFICAWINGCVKNREAGDLRCHRTHYDVTVMWINGVYCPHHSQRIHAYLLWVPSNWNRMGSSHWLEKPPNVSIFRRFLRLCVDIK